MHLLLPSCTSSLLQASPPSLRCPLSPHFFVFSISVTPVSTCDPHALPSWSCFYFLYFLYALIHPPPACAVRTIHLLHFFHLHFRFPVPPFFFPTSHPSFSLSRLFPVLSKVMCQSVSVSSPSASSLPDFPFPELVSVSSIKHTFSSLRSDLLS